MTMLPLTRRPDGIQAIELVIPAGKRRRTPELYVHEGYEWVYVLDGRLRLVLAGHDLVLAPGQAAEFDTRTPHRFGAATGGAVEFLSLFGKQGERAHLRAQPRPRGKS
jgi:quercetin dioxygenase-like cupin family protein